MNDNELMHYGVKGMKWGVHRAIRKDAGVVAARKQYNKDFNAAANAARKTKSFAVTKRGKAKQEQRAKDYDNKYDQMVKSLQKLKSAETKAGKKAEASINNTSEFTKELQRQKNYLKKKRIIQTINIMAKESTTSESVKRLSNIGSIAAISVLNQKYARDTFR